MLLCYVPRQKACLPHFVFVISMSFVCHTLCLASLCFVVYIGVILCNRSSINSSINQFKQSQFSSRLPLLELEPILLYYGVDGNGDLSAGYTRCGGLNGTWGGFGCDNNGFLTAAAAARGIYQVAVGWQILQAPKVHGLGPFGLGLLVDWVVSLAANHGSGNVLLCYGGYGGAVLSNWARWAWYGLEGLLQGWIWMGWACFWSGWASWALNWSVVFSFGFIVLGLQVGWITLLLWGWMDWVSMAHSTA